MMNVRVRKGTYGGARMTEIHIPIVPRAPVKHLDSTVQYCTSTVLQFIINDFLIIENRNTARNTGTRTAGRVGDMRGKHALSLGQKQLS